MKLISSRGWQCLGPIPIANLSGIFSIESKRSSRVDVCMAFVAVLKMTWPEFDHFFTILFIFCLQVPKSQGVIFLPGDKLWTSFLNIVSEMMVLFPMFLLLSCCVLQQPPHLTMLHPTVSKQFLQCCLSSLFGGFPLTQLPSGDIFCECHIFSEKELLTKHLSKQTNVWQIIWFSSRGGTSSSLISTVPVAKSNTRLLPSLLKGFIGN